MAHKYVDVDFGGEQQKIQVPETAVIAEFKEPEPLRVPEQDLENALQNPHGSLPFDKLVKPGMKVAIGFDDPTKPPAPWQLILPRIISKVLSFGVSRDDIVLICANGNHKKWTAEELRSFVGDEVFNGFWSTGQLINHDCLDPARLKYFGKTASGCVVEHNRAFVEADLMVYVGQVMAHSWGGYTGTGAVIGLASTESIMSHHNHNVVNHPETTLGDHKRMYFRKLKAEINAKLEREIGRRIFYINWVGGSAGRMSGIFAGYSPEVEEPAWAAADTFSRVDVPQADIFVVGLTQSFAYGSADNPLIAAIGMAYPPRIWLGDHLLKKGGVVIGVSPSNGEIDADTYPSYQEVIDLAGRHENIHDLVQYQSEIAKRPEYLEHYRDGNAYHPIHPFWLLYSCDYVLSRAAQMIIAGARNPTPFLKIGIQPTSSFEAAWQRAKGLVSENPVTVVAPTFWSRRMFKFDVTTH